MNTNAARRKPVETLMECVDRLFAASHQQGLANVQQLSDNHLGRSSNKKRHELNGSAHPQRRPEK